MKIRRACPGPLNWYFCHPSASFNELEDWLEGGLGRCSLGKGLLSISSSGAAVSVWIIRVVSGIVIPGVVAGFAIGKKAIDTISCIIACAKSSGILAQVCKLILSIRDAVVISSVKMRCIIIIRIIQRTIDNRKSARRCTPSPQTAIF